MSDDFNFSISFLLKRSSRFRFLTTPRLSPPKRKWDGLNNTRVYIKSEIKGTFISIRRNARFPRFHNLYEHFEFIISASHTYPVQQKISFSIPFSAWPERRKTIFGKKWETICVLPIPTKEKTEKFGKRKKSHEERLHSWFKKEKDSCIFLLSFNPNPPQ